MWQSDRSRAGAGAAKKKIGFYLKVPPFSHGGRCDNRPWSRSRGFFFGAPCLLANKKTVLLFGNFRFFTHTHRTPIFWPPLSLLSKSLHFLLLLLLFQVSSLLSPFFGRVSKPHWRRGHWHRNINFVCGKRQTATSKFGHHFFFFGCVNLPSW